MAVPISAQAVQVLAQGGISVPVAEVWQSDGFGMVQKATLSVLECSTTYDATGAVPRSCSLTLAGFEALIPDASSLQYAGTFADTNGTFGDGPFGDNANRQLRGLVVPGTTQVRLYDELTLPDGTTERIPAGWYWVRLQGFTHDASGVTARLSGLDVTDRISAAGYAAPHLIAHGTNVRSALVALLHAAYPGLPVTAPTTTFVTPRMAFLPIRGADPWADAKEVAYLAGWELTTDRTGGVVAFAPGDPGTGQAVWDITQAKLFSVGTETSDDEAVNRVVVNGQTAEDVPVRGVAAQLSGQWGVNSIGPRTMYEDAQVANQTQANLIAAGILRREMGLTDTLNLGADFLPHVDPWDLVDVTDPVLDLEDLTYRLMRVTTNRRDFTSRIDVARRLA